MINLIKNFVIAFLMILAVYQTAELWFGNYSDHNFFSFSINNSVNKEINDENSSLNTIIINLGNNKALYNMTDINKNEYYKDLNDIVKNVLKKGGISKTGTINWNDILSKKSLIYKYNFKLDSNAISSIFDVENNNISKIGYADYIVFICDEAENMINVRFLNSENNSYVNFLLKKEAYVKNVTEIINNSNLIEKDVYYISSELNGFNIFSSNIFIPRWQQARLDYNKYTVVKSFYDFEKNEKYADLFFDNPAGKWKSVVNNVYTYSDENNVVKFYQNGVMEYSGYNVNNNQNSDFYENYIQAVDFINKDNVLNSVFLSDFKKENDKFIFFFNYTVNDKPVYLSDEIKAETGMNSIIEVTVVNGVVTKYLRYGLDMYKKEDISYGKIDFVTAVDNILNEIETEKPVDSLELCYIVDDNNESKLNWLISIEGKNYKNSIEK